MHRSSCPQRLAQLYCLVGMRVWVSANCRPEPRAFAPKRLSQARLLLKTVFLLLPFIMAIRLGDWWPQLGEGYIHHTWRLQ